MNTLKTRSISLIMILSVIMILPSLSFADWSENFTINGFGHQSYMKSDTNSYVVSNSSDGSFNDYVFGLTFTSEVNDEISVKSQILNNEEGFKLDWGFGEYHINDDAGIKFGKVKIPAGIYNETQDVKALQPFAYLPPVYAHGVNSFNGAGIYQNFELENNWGGGIEIMGGKSVVEYGPGTADDLNLNDLFIVSANVSTPIEGTKLYYTHAQMHAEIMPGVKTTVLLKNISAAYEGDLLFVRGEYQDLEFTHEFVPENKNWFVEAGYLVRDNIQPVVRYSKAKESGIPSFTLALMDGLGQTNDQTEIGLGVNLFLSSFVVFKAEHHIIDGSNSLDLATGTNSAPSSDWNFTAFSFAFTF